MWSKIISLILGILLGLLGVFGYQKYIESKQVVDTGIDFSQVRGGEQKGENNNFPGGFSGSVNQGEEKQLNNEEGNLTSDDINN